MICPFKQENRYGAETIRDLFFVLLLAGCVGMMNFFQSLKLTVVLLSLASRRLGYGKAAR